MDSSAPESRLESWSRALSDRTTYVDTLVEAAGKPFLEALSARVALGGVGGYGRRELFPYSDVDLLILAESEAALKALKEPLAVLIRTLWDQGLRVSQSARTTAECVKFHEQNAELHISLLDARFLRGDRSLFESFESELGEFYGRHRDILVKKLAELTRSRHAKFNDTIFHLEPNVKEAPGGVRDIHFLHWINRLIPGSEALQGSVQEIGPARSFLFDVRLYLHAQSKRDNNLLSFELQDEAAKALGGGAEPAEWMRRYYSLARQTAQATGRALEYAESLDKSLLRHFRDRRSRLSTTDLTVSQDRVLIRNPGAVMQEAASILRLFLFCARHGIRLSWDARRRLRMKSTELAPLFAQQPAVWPIWQELLSQAHVSLALHEMEETGILSLAIPEWKAIDSLVVRDFYHRYTVDEHTLVALEVLDDVRITTDGTVKHFQKLFGELEDPVILRMALLLHDVGKGIRPGDHVKGSVIAAEAALNRLQAPEKSAKAILFLIEHHLDLSQVMNGRDPDDPATARFLTSRIPTLEYLRYLTLLTYADISAVNPTAMTAWRAEQLWHVYVTGQEQFVRELETHRIQRGEDLPIANRSPELMRFLEGLPTRYLRVHTADEIQHHYELQERARKQVAAVEITARKGAFLATVIAPDKPGLFSSVCGALASFGMNIVKAEAFTNSSGSAVDQFQFTDPLKTLELNPTEIDRLRRTLEQVILGTENVRVLLRGRRSAPRRPRVAKIAPIVRFNNDASDTTTLVEFIGEDRPGLLYDLGSVFAQANCSIEIVLIDTEAHRAIDVFYVTSAGEKLDDATQDHLRTALVEAAEAS